MLAEHPRLANASGWTPPPLHCTVLWNQPAVAEVLLDHHADLEQRDPDQKTTPLRYAIVFAKEQLVQLFIKRGADTGVISGHKGTALQLAVRAANGEFEDFEDTPDRHQYQRIVDLLTQK